MGFRADQERIPGRADHDPIWSFTACHNRGDQAVPALEQAIDRHLFTPRELGQEVTAGGGAEHLGTPWVGPSRDAYRKSEGGRRPDQRAGVAGIGNLVEDYDEVTGEFRSVGNRENGYRTFGRFRPCHFIENLGRNRNHWHTVRCTQPVAGFIVVSSKQSDQRHACIKRRFDGVCALQDGLSGFSPCPRAMKPGRLHHHSVVERADRLSWLGQFFDPAG